MPGGSMAGNWLRVLSDTQADTSVLAFLTTLHCALTILRHYRPRGSRNVALLPSLFFVISPWLLPSLLWLIAAFAAHIAWFVMCEKMVPPPAPRKPAAAPRSATPPVLAPAPKPKGFRPLAVLAVLAETPEIRTFRLVRPPGFTFQPGQFLMVKVEIDERPLVRCYSISSSTSAAGYLEISVRNQGQVSGFLHATVRPGMTLAVNGPGGAFVYPAGVRPIVLIAGGIGITPLLSMLRHALEAEPARSVTLLLSARSEAHLPFADELRVLARRHPQFRPAIALSGGSEQPGFFSGRIDASLIQAVVPHLRESVYLMCGPHPMLASMQQTLASLGVPEAQVHFEKFEVATTLAATAGSASAGGSVTVRLQHGGSVVSVRAGQSMLEALEAAGESIPSMCRVGVCGTCRVKLLDGDAAGDFDALDHEDQAAGYVLACVAQPLTNCVIDA